MLMNIFAGITLGLGLGTLCTATCAPVLLPHIASEYQTLRRGLLASIHFSLGRLFTYLLLGSIITYFGAAILNTHIIAPLVTILGIILIIYGFVISFGIYTGMGPKFCDFFSTTKSTILLGIFTGFRPCIPLIMAFIYAATFSSVFEGLIYIFSFWLGSSFLMPLLGMFMGLFTGVTTKWLTIERIRRISGVALLVVGLIFTIQGIALFFSPISLSPYELT